MVISLTPDVELALTEQARKLGTTPEQLALDILRDRFVPPDSNESSSKKQETLADFLRGYIGVLHSSEHIPGGANMSENAGKKFADGLLKQRKQRQ